MSAVPSQPRKNPRRHAVQAARRRKDVLRSFTLKGGSARRRAGRRMPGVSATTGRGARAIESSATVIVSRDGGREKASRVAVATPQVAAGSSRVAPAAAEELARVGETRIQASGGGAEHKTRLRTRRFSSHRRRVPFDRDARRGGSPSKRGFVFHFRLGSPRRGAGASRDRRVPPRDVGCGASARRPAGRCSATTTHARRRAALGTVTRWRLGNYFAGLAIEDCVLRSRAEWEAWRRVVRLPVSTSAHQRPLATARRVGASGAVLRRGVRDALLPAVPITRHQARAGSDGVGVRAATVSASGRERAHGEVLARGVGERRQRGAQALVAGITEVTARCLPDAG